MQEKMETLATRTELQAVANDVKTIEVAMRDTDKGVADLKKRVTVLE